MDFTYKPALKYGPNELQGMSLWALLVSVGSTAPLDDEAATLDDINNLLEFDGAGYQRIPLTGVVCDDDSANERWARLRADPLEWPDLAPAELEVLGILIYIENGAPWEEYDEYPIEGEELRQPLYWKDSGGFPQAPVFDTFRWTPSALSGLTYRISEPTGE